MLTPLNPTSIKANVAKLYAMACLANLWFITGSWLYFYRRFMTDGRIGLLDGLVFAVGLLAEVPAGAMADLLGRKRMLVLGFGLAGTGFVIQGFANQYVHILIGMLLFVIGTAFVSGADDALIYDALDQAGQAERWTHIIVRKSQIVHIATITSIFAGGLLYALQFRLPFILGGVGMLIAAVVAYGLVEVRPDIEPFSIKALIRQNVDGLKYLLVRKMRTYALMAFLILGSGYAFDLGIIKPFMLDHFGLYANAQAILNGIAAILCVIALVRLDWLRKQLGEVPGLILLAAIMGLGFLLAATPIRYYGILPFFAIVIANALVQPWLNDVVQQHALSRHRATALSALALLQKLPYIVLAPAAGLASTRHVLPQFFLVVALIILLTTSLLVVYKALKAKNHLKLNV